MRFRRTQAEKVLDKLAFYIDYSREFLRELPDLDVAQCLDKHNNSCLVRVCQVLPVPFFSRYFHLVGESLKGELSARDAVRRYEAGEVVCGISGF